MKLSKIKAESVTRANHIALSQSYVICCTGGSVSVLERATLRVIKKITAVSHLKKSLISPDERWVLILARNDSLYILSLENFTIKRYEISETSPCGSLIDGCWSFDGKSIFIPIYSGACGTSALRCYSFNDAIEAKLAFVDLLPGKYYFRCIQPLPKLKQYLFIAIDRERQNMGKEDFYKLIRFNGDTFEEIILPEIDANIAVSSIDYCERTHRMVLSGLLGLSVSFEETDGEFRRVENDRLISLRCAVDGAERLDAILKSAGCEYTAVNEIVLSSGKDNYYVSAQSGLIVVDAVTMEVVSRIRIKHGIERTVEFGERYIGIATLDGLRVYEKTHE